MAASVNVSEQIVAELKALANPDLVTAKERFFQVYPGGYGDGDSFLGVTVPLQRSIARRYRELVTPDEAKILLRNNYHEARLTGILLLVDSFSRAAKASDETLQRSIVEVILSMKDHINNWDLVDSMAPYITGPWSLHNGHKELDELVVSHSLWDKRIAIISTLAHIRAEKFDLTLTYALQLLNDPQDLIAKGVGWMLKEVGNRDISVLRSFLENHHELLSRTTLRYAIEKFSPEERKHYLTR
ncbi:MAG: DNA alkylation repair protein [Mycobacteriaceae bacterium]